MFHQFIVLNISFKISRLSPTEKSKIKCLFFFPYCVHFLFSLFFFLPVFQFFFPHFYLFILVLMKISAYRGKFPMKISPGKQKFSLFKLLIKISPEPCSRIRTFSAPLLYSTSIIQLDITFNVYKILMKLNYKNLGKIRGGRDNHYKYINITCIQTGGLVSIFSSLFLFTWSKIQ